MPLLMRPRARVAAALAALAVLAALMAGPAHAQTPADLAAAEQAAASWIIAAHDASEVITAGGIADVIFALAGAGLGAATVAEALAGLPDAAVDYLDPASAFIEARLGKVVLATVVAGGDPADLAGEDREAQLRALVRTDGADAGRIGDANVFDHALATVGLSSTTTGAPAATTGWLASVRCPDGGWSFGLQDSVGDGSGTALPCDEAGGGDVDTTAMAVQALLADAEQADAVAGGVAWLLQQQRPNGSFDDNANSTGLAAQSLRAAGEAAAADAAAAFVSGLQKPAGAPDAGAIAFRPDADGSLLLATTQGILAFGAPPFARMTPPPSGPQGPCGLGIDGVTVVVDLTAFDGGQVRSGCALGDPRSGLEALRDAGFATVTRGSDLGEFVCAIDALPELACEEPFEGSYWGYFQGSADAGWRASPIGADARDPAPGDIEGWAYGPGTPPGVPAPTGACHPFEAGVTVVVDLTAVDGGRVLQSCAPGDPTSGLDALRSAGYDIVTQRGEFGEFVCAIEGVPELACEQPFEGDFWSYSAGLPDGSWATRQVGADSADPGPGDVEGWTYSDGAPPLIAAPGAVARRIAGANRIDTAVAASRDRFADFSAGGVVLARDDDFADALAGTPLATAVGGPLLITDGDRLPDVVATEIERLLFQGTVHILGGPAAIGDAVVTQVEALGATVVRVAGADRVGTALAVAAAMADLDAFAGADTPGRVLLATGTDFADALAAGTAAAAVGDAAVLLTPDRQPHPAVDAYLAAATDAQVVAVGGPAASAYPAAMPLVGTSREETAVMVAQTFFADPAVVGLARRDAFADALAGGAHVAASGGPLLITPSEGLAEAVRDYVCARPLIDAGVVYGGDLAVAPATSLALATAITGESCS